MAEDRMINGYKQNTKEFGKLLRYSKPLGRVMRYVATQQAWYFRKNLPRSATGVPPASADQIEVVKVLPGGRRKDRMEFRVVARRQKNFRNAMKTQREGLVFLSDGGKTISRGGRVN